MNCLTTNGTNHTNENKRNIKIHFGCVCLCALSVRRGEHCDLFFTTEGTEFTEKAETQQVGAWGEERGASSENVPDAEFLVHRGFLRELRVLRGDDCD